MCGGENTGWYWIKMTLPTAFITKTGKDQNREGEVIFYNNSSDSIQNGKSILLTKLEPAGLHAVLQSTGASAGREHVCVILSGLASTTPPDGDYPALYSTRT